MDALTIVDPLKFGIGCLFLGIGLAVLWHARGMRGFGQKRQIGALLVIGAGVFLAVGLGLIRT
ncbi:MAG: hypothetical protein AB7O91_07965 [Sphingomonas sp.]